MPNTTRHRIAFDPNHVVRSAVYSKDSRWIAFVEEIDVERSRLVIAPFRDGTAALESGWIPVTSDEYRNGHPQWSPDGRALYFSSNRDGFVCLWRQRIAPDTKLPVGAPEAVRHFHSPTEAHRTVMYNRRFYSVSGGRLSFIEPDFRSNIWVTRIPR